MNTNEWIQFCKDWNSGMTAKDMASKYGCNVSTIRNWVNTLRKKGVKLEKRVKSHLEIDVETVNRALR